VWTTFFYVLIAIGSGLCLTGCVFVAQRATADAESLRKRLRSCESRIESISNSVEEQTATLTELANRVKMQRVRNVVNHAAGSSGEPDPYKNPDEWRAMMTRKIALAKVGVKQ
jgi:TolA-binding protein